MPDSVNNNIYIKTSFRHFAFTTVAVLNLYIYIYI